MTRGSEARKIFQRMYRAGVRDKKIMASACGVAIRTVRNYVEKTNRDEPLETERRPRPPTKFSRTVRNSIRQLMRAKPTPTSREVAASLERRWGNAFSSSGVRRTLKSMGYRHSASKATVLTPANRRARLEWAKSREGTDWNRIWSFDEAYFNLEPSRGRVYYSPATVHRAQQRRLTTKQTKISIGIAVAVSHNTKSKICFLKSNWGPMDLRDVLRDELLPSINWDRNVRRYRAFLIDNDGRHHNRQVKAFLEEKGLLRVGYQPSNSPDLNPIENVFSLMKRFVQKEAPSTEQDLRECIAEAWESIEPKTLQSLFDSMPSRLAEVVEKKGDRTQH